MTRSSRKRLSNPGQQRARRKPMKLRQWDEKSMDRALELVASGSKGVNRAAFECHVPATTLKDRVSGRVAHGCTMGAKPYLTRKEEKELVNFILQCAKMGYGRTRQNVLRITEQYVRAKKGCKLRRLSNGWWNGFLKRWPQLSLRKGDAFAAVREEASNESVFKNYFTLLDEIMTKNCLKDQPSQIYNCDESGMPLHTKTPKVIAAKGTKKVRQICTGNKTQISILACASATGQVIPPMVIFSGKRFNKKLSEGEIPGTLYGMSENGWMDQELFSTWFMKHFLLHAVSARPLLLMLDGHSSHYSLELVQAAAQENVILFCLPPHTTADSQPLDTSCFGPLKNYWSETCRQYLFDNPGKVITKFDFSELFAEAWSKGMTIANVVSGFRHTGIYPFAPNSILDKFPSHTESQSPQGDISSVPPPNTDNAATSHQRPGSFSAEKIALYEKRLENGYDIYSDVDYVSWLEQFHPEQLPSLDAILKSASDDSTYMETPELAGEHSCSNTYLPESNADRFSAPFDLEPDPLSRETHVNSWPPEIIELYQKRYENEYNIFTNKNYVDWLRQFHPEHLPRLGMIASNDLSSCLEAHGGQVNTSECSTAASEDLLSHPPSQPTITNNADQENSSDTPNNSNAKLTRSPLSELLIYPSLSNTNKTSEKNFSARVLTSNEAIAILEEKKRKKIQEKEEKELRKKDRELKKIAREEEKRCKALQREAKKAATRNKKDATVCSKRTRSTSNNTARPQNSCDSDEKGLQHREISQNECAACFGQWDEDESDEWIKCINKECSVWSHANCLERSEQGYICVICQTFFI